MVHEVYLDEWLVLGVRFGVVRAILSECFLGDGVLLCFWEMCRREGFSIKKIKIAFVYVCLFGKLRESSDDGCFWEFEGYLGLVFLAELIRQTTGESRESSDDGCFWEFEGATGEIP